MTETKISKMINEFITSFDNKLKSEQEKLRQELDNLPKKDDLNRLEKASKKEELSKIRTLFLKDTIKFYESIKKEIKKDLEKL